MKFTRSQERTQAPLPVTEVPDEVFDEIEKTSKEEVKEPEVFKPMIGKVTPIKAANTRKGPDVKTPSLGVVYPGEKFEVQVFDNEWYQITSGDKKGAYIRKDLVK